MKVRTVLLLGGTLLSTASLHGQTTVLDEGSFRLTVGGKEVGMETFSIRQSGSGQNAVIIAFGRVTLNAERGAQELSSELQVAGGTLRPAAYEVRVQGNDPGRITGRVVGGRFSAQIVSPAGEMMREYLAGDGAVLVDEGVAHHHYFIARRLEGSSARMPLIIPRQNRQITAQIVDGGGERIAVAGRALDARKLVITPGGAPARTVWVDGSNRVLRLEIPDREFVAQRVAVPK